MSRVTVSVLFSDTVLAVIFRERISSQKFIAKFKAKIEEVLAQHQAVDGDHVMITVFKNHEALLKLNGQMLESQFQLAYLMLEQAARQVSAEMKAEPPTEAEPPKTPCRHQLLRFHDGPCQLQPGPSLPVCKATTAG